MTIFNPTTGIPNPQNPYDQIGKLHNDGLASVGNSIQWAKTNTSPETIFSETGKFLDSQNMTRDFASSYQRAKGSFDAVLQKRQTTSTDDMTAGLSPKATSYIKQATDAITNSSVPNPKIIAATFIRIESDVMSDASLSKDEQSAVLASLAVGRYSADYWTNFTTQNAGMITNSGNSTLLNSKVKDVVKADLKGALAGAISGAIKGALAGPAAEAGAVGVGAASGAIAFSVVEGIFAFF